jgi:hypothetical protein
MLFERMDSLPSFDACFTQTAHFPQNAREFEVARHGMVLHMQTIKTADPSLGTESDTQADDPRGPVAEVLILAR